jgi:hypothetical protein
MAHEFKAADAARCKADFLDCPVKLGQVYEVTKSEERLVWVTDWHGFVGGPYPASWFEPVQTKAISMTEGMEIAEKFSEEVCALIETRPGMFVSVAFDGIYTIKMIPPLMRAAGHEHCVDCQEEMWDPPALDLLSVVELFDDIQEAYLDANFGMQIMGMHRGVTINLDIDFIPPDGAPVSGVVENDGSWKVFDKRLASDSAPPKHEQN